ncbi:MAG: hypothetical protein J5884_07060 [Paludibacteraceae bacterium]|nr:hypothetical protein [Paludibacteraceae bacterium]
MCKKSGDAAFFVPERDQVSCLMPKIPGVNRGSTEARRTLRLSFDCRSTVVLGC